VPLPPPQVHQSRSQNDAPVGGTPN